MDEKEVVEYPLAEYINFPIVSKVIESNGKRTFEFDPSIVYKRK